MTTTDEQWAELLDRLLKEEYGDEDWPALGSLRRIAAVIQQRHQAEVREGKREALLAAADRVKHVRENGLPEGVYSHPTAEHFEAWLRVRAESYATERDGEGLT